MTEQFPPLSTLVQGKLAQLFEPDDRKQAEGMLLPVTNMGPKPVSIEGADRCRLAVLKLSNGRLAALRGAVRTYHIDPRDLLMEAGFGSDLEAHIRWAEEGA